MRILLNKNFIRIFMLCLLVLSCGLPDVTSIYLEMNQPFITKVISGDNKITIEFEAQNNEPAFSGYNIYFGDNVNPQKYRIYNSQKARPTISAGATDTPTKHTYTVESGCYYSEGSGEILTLTTPSSQLQNGIPVYVYVSAYQITPQNESYYYYDNYVQMACPRSETLGASISLGNITSGGRTLATLSGTAGNLTFQTTGGGGIQSVAATSLNDITFAPTTGYNTSADVQAQRLYLVKVVDGGSSYYGKIFVRSVIGTSATVDYCLQSAADITNY